MKEIEYKSIDFSKLKELDVKSEENQIFVDENIENVYKLFRSINEKEISDKEEKLKILDEMRMYDYLSIPKAKIKNGILVGTLEDYIDGFDLSDIMSQQLDMNDIMTIFIKVSQKLEDIHNNKIVVSDLNAGNIRIDTSLEPHFLDVASYSIEKYNSYTISGILSSYFIEHNIRPTKITKEHDKISYLMLIFNLLFNKRFYHITYHNYNDKMEKIVYLKQLQEFFEILRNREEFVDVPYLHEIISKEDVKKYKKEMR